MLNKEQAYYLLQKLMDGKASSAERATLSQLLQQNHPQEQWIELMEELYHVQSQTEQPVYNETEWKPVLEQLLQNVRAHNPKVIPMWKRIAIAASIVGIIFLTYYVINTREQVVRGPSSVVQTDVPAPDRNRAQIKLSDGSIVYLDSAANGELVNANGVTVTKTEDGKIVYSSLTTHHSPLTISYNTLTNPRGSKVIDITLSDGSRVWLNAESSITYPAAFIGKERKVTITGEAYFEVAKHDLPPALAGGKKEVRMPFIVSANNKADVTVLGTHFNVNAYEDEKDIKVTLVEGSVRVSNDVDAKTIKPNQQVTVEAHSPLTIHHSPDIDAVMAWKNGKFVFGEKADIQTIMRQIARWYDVTVEYKGNVNGFIGGSISRQVNVSNVLKMLEKTGEVKFIIEGNKITVLP